MLENDKCETCGGDMNYYDRVLRIIRSNNRKTARIYIKRFRCCKCGKIHRKLPSDLFPYKQYESRIITGVIDGTITSDMIEYEEYPCEMTMKRWKAQYLQSLL